MEGCLFIILVIVAALIAIPISISQAEKRREAAAQEAARERAERERAEAERQRDFAQQNQFITQIRSINEESLSAFESMPVEVETAEKYLDQAEVDFSEGAFAPFWTSVEKATLALARFDENVSKIERNSSKYVDLVKGYRGRSPVFSISPDSTPKLKIAFETSKRMSEIVRKAQRNFEFSLIYEQRKTNQILVAGFRSLAQALEEMTWRITSSIDDLTNSVDRMSSTLNASLQKIHDQTERIAVSAEKHREEVAKEASGRGERERKTLEMLDNLQRKRYPSIIHGGLR